MTILAPLASTLWQTGTYSLTDSIFAVLTLGSTVEDGDGLNYIGYNMQYDAAGNRTNLAAFGQHALDAGASYGSVSYGYNTKNDLMGESSTQNGGFSNNFFYDAAGNPTTFRSTPGIPYNAANQRTGPQAFAYDGNGNPTTYKGYPLTFDAENRLKTHGTLTADYNGDGLRVVKQTGTGTTYFLYEGTTLVCEMDASGTVTATNTFGANGLVSRRTGTTSVFYTFDPQGSVAQRLDVNGNILSNDLYDAYGNKMAGNPGNDPYGYGGQWGYYTDAETGLILCTHRYYDPATGRFLTRDPIGPAGGINLYAYVDNNPINWIDPDGTTPAVLTTGIGTGVGALGGFFYGMGSQTVSAIKGNGFSGRAVLGSTAGGALIGMGGGAIVGAMGGDPTGVLVAGKAIPALCVATGVSFAGGALDGMISSPNNRKKGTRRR